MARKNNYVKRSVSFSKDILMSLDIFAAKENIDTSELVRRYVEKGMNISKAKDDIDFIRKQLREELILVLDKRLNWINAMYYRIGSYVVPQCRFTAEIVYKLTKLTDEQHLDFQEFWEKAKNEGNQFISTGIGPLNSKKEKLTLEEIHELNEKAFGRKK